MAIRKKNGNIWISLQMGIIYRCQSGFIRTPVQIQFELAVLNQSRLYIKILIKQLNSSKDMNVHLTFRGPCIVSTECPTR